MFCEFKVVGKPNDKSYLQRLPIDAQYTIILLTSPAYVVPNQKNMLQIFKIVHVSI